MDSVVTLITSGGPHPISKWADLTATKILDLVQIDPSSTSQDAVLARYAKRDLYPALFGIFERAYDKAKLDLKGPLDPSPYIPMDEFKTAISGTPFAGHFENHSDLIRHIIGKNAANVMHTERCYQEK